MSTKSGMFFSRIAASSSFPGVVEAIGSVDTWLGQLLCCRALGAFSLFGHDMKKFVVDAIVAVAS